LRLIERPHHALPAVEPSVHVTPWTKAPSLGVELTVKTGWFQLHHGP